ncbi:MAG: L,D-transpeptidase family protein, partial [Bacteroidota bacterium]
ENELIFTDGALSFLHDVAYGKEIQVSYNGLKYYVDSNKLINSLNQILEKGNWENGLMSLEPSLKQYAGLKKELGSMQRFAGSMENTDTMVVSVAADYKKAVSLKLQVYGLLPSSDQAATDLALHNAVMEFQKKVNLPPTGELDEKVIAALNFPLFERVEQIKQSLNYWRWTSRIKQPEFIMVNIPAARLQVVAIDAPEKNISMKVIVGKPITQTPPFAAYIYRVITYPYWTVPLSIATKEMLPKIINKVTYLEDNSLHVLDNKGEELNPSDIKWRKYSNNNFPFTIRQSTGCDNSLGILKFDINSPYAIYLHDTNLRGLFEKENRFLSHGCVRVEKPIELARYILGKEFDKDIEEHLNRCLKGEEPAEIRLKEKLPVLIFYMPADIDENGALKFYPDVYEIGKKGFSTSNVATPGEVGLPD